MKIYLILICLLQLSFSNNAQTTDLGENIYGITKYIVNNKVNENDLVKVDSIYKYSISFNNYNISETLLSLTFATIPFNEFPFTIPIINIRIKVPIFSVNDSLFYLKNKKLPKVILFDSPGNDFGDKDKLAHFFGSAFISYNSNLFDFTKIIGIFVEEFEEEFKVDSKFDNRDILIDDLGNMFGKLLKRNKDALPSNVLIYNSLKYFTYKL